MQIEWALLLNQCSRALCDHYGQRSGEASARERERDRETRAEETFCSRMNPYARRSCDKPGSLPGRSHAYAQAVGCVRERHTHARARAPLNTLDKLVHGVRTGSLLRPANRYLTARHWCRRSLSIFKERVQERVHSITKYISFFFFLFIYLFFYFKPTDYDRSLSFEKKTQVEERASYLFLSLQSSWLRPLKKRKEARPERNAYYLESVCRSVTKTKLQLENCGNKSGYANRRILNFLRYIWKISKKRNRCFSPDFRRKKKKKKKKKTIERQWSSLKICYSGGVLKFSYSQESPARIRNGPFTETLTQFCILILLLSAIRYVYSVDGRHRKQTMRLCLTITH
ncbi:hypothetical protein PUN28_010966 [Cardiocondyla obscurior]|uniref:Uncharacterized protein n=1 Tax=Cardiocondyla obscurior TaxID=286306 RepID=A0AAW2FL71_9HYME